MSSSMIPKRPFKPRITSGSIPARKGKLVAKGSLSASAGITSPNGLPKPRGKVKAGMTSKSGLPKPRGKVKGKVKASKATVFQPYTIPKLKPPLADTPNRLSRASTLVSPAAASYPAVTFTDMIWSLRNYDGVQCMVVSLIVKESSVKIRTSEMVDGFKIPPENDSRVRDWTKTTAFEDEHEAMEFAKSTLNTALDDDFTLGTCPNCSGPGRFTESQLSKKEGLLRAGKIDGRGADAICRRCDKLRRLQDSLKHTT